MLHSEVCLSPCFLLSLVTCSCGRTICLIPKGASCLNQNQVSLLLVTTYPTPCKGLPTTVWQIRLPNPSIQRWVCWSASHPWLWDVTSQGDIKGPAEWGTCPLGMKLQYSPTYLFFPPHGFLSVIFFFFFFPFLSSFSTQLCFFKYIK